MFSVGEGENKKEFNAITEEILHYRGDNQLFRNAMLQQIAIGGDCNLMDLSINIAKSKPDPTRLVGQATATIDAYYLAAGMKTNLVHKTDFHNSGQSE
jgi:hypothetical protein